MIALDANLLIYAHRSSTPEHRFARRAIERALADRRGCGIAAPSIAEFWSVATHRRASARPSTPEEARRFLSSLLEQAAIPVWLGGDGFGPRLSRLAAALKIRGLRIFDLQIALTAFDNGATEIWTHDRDFAALPGMTIRDPL